MINRTIWVSKDLRILFFFYFRKHLLERFKVFLIDASVVNGEGYITETACVLAVSGEEGGEVAGDVVGVVLENAATPCA